MLRTGRQLKAARALAGLSQRQLAEYSGLHPKTISYWEARGRCGLQQDYKQRIVDALAARGVQLLEDGRVGCYLDERQVEPAAR